MLVRGGPNGKQLLPIFIAKLPLDDSHQTGANRQYEAALQVKAFAKINWPTRRTQSFIVLHARQFSNFPTGPTYPSLLQTSSVASAVHPHPRTTSAIHLTSNASLTCLSRAS